MSLRIRSACLMLFILPCALHAQTFIVWGNDGTSFNAGADWVGGTAPKSSPSPGSYARFSSPTIADQPDTTAPISIVGLNFETGGWILGGDGGSITLTSAVGSTNSAISVVGTNLTETINANLILSPSSGGVSSIQAQPTDQLILNGTVSATNPVTVDFLNQGTFVVNGTNTYSGTTAWNNADSVTEIGNKAAFGTSTLLFTSNTATLSAGTDLTGTHALQNAVSLDSGMVLNNNLGHNLELAGAVTLGGTGQRTIENQAGQTTFSGIISGGSSTALALTADSGSINLTGQNTYGGTTTIEGAGTVVLGTATTLAGATGDLVIAGGTLQAAVSTTIGGNVTLNSGSLNVGSTQLTLAAGKSLAISGGAIGLTLGTNAGQIAGSGSVTVTGGSLALNTSGAGFSYGDTYQVFSGFGTTNYSELTLTGFDSADYTASLSSDGDLSFSAVPEPATYALIMGLGALGFVAYPKRAAFGFLRNRQRYHS